MLNVTKLPWPNGDFLKAIDHWLGHCLILLNINYTSPHSPHTPKTKEAFLMGGGRSEEPKKKFSCYQLECIRLVTWFSWQPLILFWFSFLDVFWQSLNWNFLLLIVITGLVIFIVEVLLDLDNKKPTSPRVFLSWLDIVLFFKEITLRSSTHNVDHNNPLYSVYLSSF